MIFFKLSEKKIEDWFHHDHIKAEVINDTASRGLLFVLCSQVIPLVTAGTKLNDYSSLAAKEYISLKNAKTKNPFALR
jgi:hypothetical protein